MPEFVERCVMEEKIYLAVPKSSKYAGLKYLELKDVRDECFVQLAGSRLFRNVCDTYCAYAGFKPHTVFESDSPLAVKNIIGASAGIGFWPEYSWGSAESFDSKLVPIVNPVCQRELIVGVCTKSRISHVAKDFYGYLIDFIRKRQH